MTNIYFEGNSVCLDELEARGARAAAALSGFELKRDDVVAIVLRNDPVIIEVLSCIRYLGAIRAILPWHLESMEFRRILGAMQPRLIITHADLYPKVVMAIDTGPAVAIVQSSGERPHADSFEATSTPSVDAPAIFWENLIHTSSELLSFPHRKPGALTVTSGSTGKPKIIRWDTPPPLGPRFYQRMTQCPAIETAIVTAPLCNSAQNATFHQAWYARANQVILSEFEPKSFLAAVERYRVNYAFLMPAMFVRLLRLPQRTLERYDVSTLNFVFHTGALCAPEIKKRMIDRWGPILWEAYGCSETSVIAMSDSHEWLAKPGTVGQPMRSVIILDVAGEPCAPGVVGQIAVDTAGLPPGHFETGVTQLWMCNNTQYMATGDLGWLDRDGYLYLRGRVDDLINTGRIQVYPAEIENALLEHPAVLDCAVFPIPNPEFGQSIAAIVELTNPDINANSVLREFLKDRISSYKIPVKISSQTTPIRTPAGKINRAKLTATAN